jgi:hypothetical protein
LFYRDCRACGRISLEIIRLKDRSRAFTFLPVQELLSFVKRAETEDQTAVMRAFTQWVRETLVAKAGKSNGRQKQ